MVVAQNRRAAWAVLEWRGYLRICGSLAVSWLLATVWQRVPLAKVGFPKTEGGPE